MIWLPLYLSIQNKHTFFNPYKILQEIKSVQLKKKTGFSTHYNIIIINLLKNSSNPSYYIKRTHLIIKKH